MAPGVNSCSFMSNEACANFVCDALPRTVAEDSSHKVNRSHSPAFIASLRPSPAFVKMIQSYRANPFFDTAPGSNEPVNMSATIGVELGKASGRAPSPWLIAGAVILVGVIAGADYLYNYEKNRTGKADFSGVIAAISADLFGNKTMSAEPKLPDLARDKPDEKKLVTPENAPSWKTLVPAEKTIANKPASGAPTNPCLKILQNERPDLLEKYLALEKMMEMFQAQQVFFAACNSLTDLFNTILHSKDGVALGPLNEELAIWSSIKTRLDMCANPRANAATVSGRIIDTLDRMNPETLQSAYELVLLRQQIIVLVGSSSTLLAHDWVAIKKMLEPFIPKYPVFLRFFQ